MQAGSESMLFTDLSIGEYDVVRPPCSWSFKIDSANFLDFHLVNPPSNPATLFNGEAGLHVLT